MIAEKRYICHFCKNELIFEVKIGRSDICPHCGEDLHCCMNCRLYDPTVTNQCKELFCPFIRDRNKAAVCHFFEFKPYEESNEAEVNLAKAKLEAMFQEAKGASGEKKFDLKLKKEEGYDNTMARLESLFKK